MDPAAKQALTDSAKRLKQFGDQIDQQLKVLDVKNDDVDMGMNRLTRAVAADDAKAVAAAAALLAKSIPAVRSAIQIISKAGDALDKESAVVAKYSK